LARKYFSRAPLEQMDFIASTICSFSRTLPVSQALLSPLQLYQPQLSPLAMSLVTQSLYIL
ncbi:hypothetical protein A2U01_0063845, partial [Trifolium medium]|nr:hypothetical protein [Trifolium medium]